jgi:hypothetical protein
MSNSPPRGRRILRAALVTALATLSAAQSCALDAGPKHPRGAGIAAYPPSASGYFRTKTVGAWRSLPGDSRCAARVHRSSWEPRPDNAGANSTMPKVSRVHAAFAARPRSGGGGYKRTWDTWLLPRVTGHYTGRTDEIIQWAACKWGIADNVLRAITVRESTWYQYEVYRSGRCVTDWGCGDLVEEATTATRRYCTAISRRGHDYQADYAPGICPKTFSIAGVMSWQDPAWGRMAGNQNGTFPFNRNSTAFALDYLGSYLRGCYEGWEPWLSEAGPVAYAAGDLWGCVGSWYAGEWRTTRALAYVHRVRRDLRDRTWLGADWKDIRPPCSAQFGCASGVGPSRRTHGG